MKENGMRTVNIHGSKMIAETIMAMDDRYEIANRSSSLSWSGAKPNHKGVPTAPVEEIQATAEGLEINKE